MKHLQGPFLKLLPRIYFMTLLQQGCMSIIISCYLHWYGGQLIFMSIVFVKLHNYLFQIYSAFFFAGGVSHGCPENSGAAGTLYDVVPRSLIVCNNNLSTQTDTLFLLFPNQPLWTNVFVKNRAKVDVPFLWTRVQVSYWCMIIVHHYTVKLFDFIRNNDLCNVQLLSFESLKLLKVNVN